MKITSSSQAFAIGFVLWGCSMATVDIKGMKSESAEISAAAYKSAKNGSAKFFFNEFNDEYEGDKKIKKLAIAYYQIGWDPGKDWRDKGRFMNPGQSKKEYQDVVNSSVETMKAEFEKLGYQVLLPSELKEKSSTFAALKPNYNFINEDMPGRRFETYTASESRYIHAITNQGKLVSKIAKEADVDAVIGVFFNDYGTGSGETKYKDNFVLSVNSHISYFFTICVPREKAKEAGVSLGVFGDANHCGQVVDGFEGRYMLPDMRHDDKPDFNELKLVGFEGITSIYKAANRGIVQAIYEEGMK